MPRFFSPVGVIAILLAFSGVARATTTLKIGTLAPKDSPWGKEFGQWASEVAADTNGEMQLDFQWSGQAGDEVLMVQKIRSGQLDGAALTAVGLAQTGVTDVLLFQMPGLFAPLVSPPPSPSARAPDSFEVTLNQCVMRVRESGGAQPAVCQFPRPLDQMDFGQLHCNARCKAEAGLDTHASSR